MKHIKLFSATILLLSLLLAGCAGTHTSESTGQYLDSGVTTTKVNAALLNAKDVKSRHIHVTTYKDTVQLSGFVTDRRQVKRAGEIASKVKGVKSVKNDLIVRSAVK